MLGRSLKPPAFVLTGRSKLTRTFFLCPWASRGAETWRRRTIAPHARPYANIVPGGAAVALDIRGRCIITASLNLKGARFGALSISMNNPEMGCAVPKVAQGRTNSRMGTTGLRNSKGRPHVWRHQTRPASVQSFPIRIMLRVDVWLLTRKRNSPIQRSLSCWVAISPKLGRTLGYRRRRNKPKSSTRSKARKVISLRQASARSTRSKRNQGPPSKMTPWLNRRDRCRRWRAE